MLGVCNCGYILLSHLGKIVTRIETQQLHNMYMYNKVIFRFYQSPAETIKLLGIKMKFVLFLKMLCSPRDVL